ncbi:hypothetical protein, partial [Vibrio cholerae]|uniref:hypothetical protein n=1 Tax=Vibrio cholerae TaxID=666 RepID=UPI001F1F37DE
IRYQTTDSIRSGSTQNHRHETQHANAVIREATAVGARSCHEFHQLVIPSHGTNEQLAVLGEGVETLEGY